MMDVDYGYHRLVAQLSILKDVAKTYPMATIGNIITQLQSRINYLKNLNGEQETDKRRT